MRHSVRNLKVGLGKVSFALSGGGSITHLVDELLKSIPSTSKEYRKFMAAEQVKCGAFIKAIDFKE